MKSCISLLIASFLLHGAQGFCPSIGLPFRSRRSAATALASTRAATFHGSNSAETKSKQEEKENYWLKDFSIASGEIIDPYNVLKISRKAEGPEVRRAYIEQSRRYHPDGARHRKFLPGSCNNIEEVREQWERIKLAYEILYVCIATYTSMMIRISLSSRS